MDRDSTMQGATHALGHAVRLLEDAAILYATKRTSSSFLLAVAAREEVGRFNILTSAANQILEGASISVEDMRRRLKPNRKPHQVKLQAGQSTFYTRSPLPVESFVERQQRYAELRKSDSEALHNDRLAAQYVELRANGTWSVPSATRLQDAHQLIWTIAGEIGDLLRWSETDIEFRELLSRFSESLPRSEDFLNRMFSLPAGDVEA
jgi:AbiV family abortive infection protein